MHVNQAEVASSTPPKKVFLYTQKDCVQGHLIHAILFIALLARTNSFYRKDIVNISTNY